MTIKLKHILVAVATTAYIGASGVVGWWMAETAAPFQPRVELITVQQGETVEVEIPFAQKAMEVEVFSVIEGAEDSQAEDLIQTPRMVMYKGYSSLHSVMVPPTLNPGTYTVVVNLGYAVNPIKYVRQSVLVAVLLVKEGVPNGKSSPNATR